MPSHGHVTVSKTIGLPFMPSHGFKLGRKNDWRKIMMKGLDCIGLILCVTK
jgi:hypothetical protein